jgi:DNA-binding CsgD family transcriptional regulator
MMPAEIMRETSGMLAEALHMLDYALLIVDEEARIGFKNREAERVLDQFQSLHENERGCLIARPRAMSVRVREAIHGACRNARVAGFRLAKPGGPHSSLRVIVTPLSAANGALGAAGRAAVWVIDTGSPGLSDERLLCTLFDLSPAEARLALGLLAGQTLAQCSRRAGVGLATVRSQLNSIFAKTDTRRQAGLVALLSKLPALKFPPA